MNTRRSRSWVFLALGLFLVTLASSLSWADSRTLQCFTTTENTCPTNCFSTGNWWQCLPIFPNGYQFGVCDVGNNPCTQAEPLCNQVWGCPNGEGPPWGSCGGDGTVKLCVPN